ncbi:MAG TPA: MarR family transcriptional regulator [Gemmatimonadaceae bacterium]
MARSIREEIKQAKPFGSLEQEATLSIARTAAQLEHALVELFKPYGITPTQYNVLRILRGAGEAGLCRFEVSDRLVAQVPDVTRLLDRLERMGLVARARDTLDRRVVVARMTPAGLALLAELEGLTAEFHRRHLGHLGARQLRTLIDLLAEARAPR